MSKREISISLLVYLYCFVIAFILRFVFFCFLLFVFKFHVQEDNNNGILNASIANDIFFVFLFYAYRPQTTDPFSFIYSQYIALRLDGYHIMGDIKKYSFLESKLMVLSMYNRVQKRAQYVYL